MRVAACRKAPISILLLPLVTFLEYLHLRKLKLHIPKLLRLRGDPFILRRKYPLLLLLEVTDLRR
jgi:hypothetical protein